MKIYVDADGCPVVNETIQIAKKHNIKCVLICDTSHYFERDGATTITVEKGADSADFALVNLAQKGDIVVTQDYGLATMCLAKSAIAVSQDGMEYNDNNIDALLMQRHTAKKIRMSGGKLKGNPKRTKEQTCQFISKLNSLLGD